MFFWVEFAGHFFTGRKTGCRGYTRELVGEQFNFEMDGIILAPPPPLPLSLSLSAIYGGLGQDILQVTSAGLRWRKKYRGE